MFYHKFPFQIKDIDIDNIKGNSIYKKTNFEEFAISNADYLETKLVQSFIFQKKPDQYNLTEIKYPGTNIHTDSYNTALNIYLKTSIYDLTLFYELNEKDLYKNLNVTEYLNNTLKLLSISKFGTGDCVLINTKIPHAVRITNRIQNRLVLRLLWKNDVFMDILNSISILDNKINN